ncbi:MAG TPA: NAD(+)--rifampin ADP-ribosyltransferase [Ensifer sp.]|nr:NAD(+)--rifampin ADP-ribosyltransferase [Ensifer sp.]
MNASPTMFKQSFFHGTRAELKPGDQISVGYRSNFREEKPLSWVYFAATLDAAVWGAELATGNGPERIYVVEPCGPFEDDPNVTDKRFPGNPTMSYRSREPLRVIAEVTKWKGHPPERLVEMKAGLARLQAEGRNHIID